MSPSSKARVVYFSVQLSSVLLCLALLCSHSFCSLPSRNDAMNLQCSVQYSTLQVLSLLSTSNLYCFILSPLIMSCQIISYYITSHRVWPLLCTCVKSIIPSHPTPSHPNTSYLTWSVGISYAFSNIPPSLPLPSTSPSFTSSLHH